MTRLVLILVYLLSSTSILAATQDELRPIRKIGGVYFQGHEPLEMEHVMSILESCGDPKVESLINSRQNHMVSGGFFLVLSVSLVLVGVSVDNDKHDLLVSGAASAAIGAGLIHAGSKKMDQAVDLYNERFIGSRVALLSFNW